MLHYYLNTLVNIIKEDKTNLVFREFMLQIAIYKIASSSKTKDKFKQRFLFAFN